MNFAQLNAHSCRAQGVLHPAPAFEPLLRSFPREPSPCTNSKIRRGTTQPPPAAAEKRFRDLSCCNHRTTRSSPASFLNANTPRLCCTACCQPRFGDRVHWKTLRHLPGSFVDQALRSCRSKGKKLGKYVTLVRLPVRMLSKGFFPWSAVIEVAAMTRKAAQRASATLERAHVPPVAIRPEWYY